MSNLLSSLAVLHRALPRRDSDGPRRIHDYRHRYWGHDYTLTPNRNPKTARVSGWGYGLRRGDFLLIAASTPERLGLYRLRELDYYRDPRDMWHGTAVFVSGSSRLGQRLRAVTADVQEASREDPFSVWWVLP